MTEQLVLSDAEMELVLELLEAERRDLPVEIRHSFRSEVHDRLQERLRTVEALIERLKLAPAGR